MRLDASLVVSYCTLGPASVLRCLFTKMGLLRVIQYRPLGTLFFYHNIFDHGRTGNPVFEPSREESVTLSKPFERGSRNLEHECKLATAIEPYRHAIIVQ